MDKVKEFKKIVTEMADLYEKKNKNYGDSFGKLYKDLGAVAGLVPLHNKLDRATNLVKGGINNFESLEDTFKDLACYAIMNLIAMKEEMKEEVKEEVKEEAVEVKPLDIDDKYQPCDYCIRRFKINGCDGCPYASTLTCSKDPATIIINGGQTVTLQSGADVDLNTIWDNEED